MTEAEPDGPGWKFATKDVRAQSEFLVFLLSFLETNIILGISTFSAAMPWPRFEGWPRDTQTLAEVPGCLF